eukprot:TRINITY_DN2702_c0_g1_i1.p1 TRINITY_DN2702_c0_g1~~TRINITY_DN2702_c0_g1_i1.p1  ORF type:complete len:268 (-),score=15.38 TRINITY_DN2702_c0_g1_i1:189-992(-)
MDHAVLLLAATGLRMADVARWRAADISTKRAFDIDGDENVWLNCARSQFKAERLFATYALYARRNRKLCFRFHSMLQRANYMLSSAPLSIENIEEANHLVLRLREAICACSDHRASSRRDAQVLVGQFPLHESADILFQFGGEGHLPPVAGLPPGILLVRLFLNSGKLMTCAIYLTIHGNLIKPYREGASIRFTLSAASADPEASMSCRGIRLFLDGRWRASACRIRSQSSLKSGLDWPVVCVLTLLEGEPSDSRRCLANALNLERY